VSQEILISLTLFITSVIQTVAGFGFALFAMPALILLDLSLPQAVLVLTVCAFYQTVVAAYHLRAHIPWNFVARATLWRALFIPVGVGLLVFVDQLPVDKIKLILGITILVILACKRWLRIGDKSSKLLANSFFALSGLMAGALGIGGPALVLWVTSQRWPSEKVRAFLFTNFAIAIPLAATIVCWRFLDQVKSVFWLCLICMPCVYAGTLIGRKLSRKVSQQLFERIVFFLLLLMAVGMVAGAIN